MLYEVITGDPETQPIMLRMRSDLVELCLAACDGKLDTKAALYDERAAIGVVLAAANYPAEPQTGDVMSAPNSIGQFSIATFTPRLSAYSITGGQISANNSRLASTLLV